MHHFNMITRNKTVSHFQKAETIFNASLINSHQKIWSVGVFSRIICMYFFYDYESTLRHTEELCYQNEATLRF